MGRRACPLMRSRRTLPLTCCRKDSWSGKPFETPCTLPPSRVQQLSTAYNARQQKVLEAHLTWSAISFGYSRTGRTECLAPVAEAPIFLVNLASGYPRR